MQKKSARNAENNMDWQQLKQNKCPSCGTGLEAEIFDAMYHCGNRCGFKISEERFDSLLGDMTKGKFVEPEEEDNLQGLSNL